MDVILLSLVQYVSPYITNKLTSWAKAASFIVNSSERVAWVKAVIAVLSLVLALANVTLGEATVLDVDKVSGTIMTILLAVINYFASIGRYELKKQQK